jgi:hypothetical protein
LLTLAATFTYKNIEAFQPFVTAPKTLLVEMPIVIAVIVGASLALAVALFVGIRKHPERTKRILLGAYCVIGVVIIAYLLVFPTFTAREASERLASWCDGEWVVGGALSTELSYENRIKPLIWQPGTSNFGHLNKDAISRYRPKCYLRPTYWTGRADIDSRYPPQPKHINKTLTQLDTFEIWPIFGRPRAVLELYQIEYTDDGSTKVSSRT